jgi:hypothetical protein
MPTSRGDQQRARAYAEHFGVDYNVARRAVDELDTASPATATILIESDHAATVAAPCRGCGTDTEQRVEFVWWPRLRTTCRGCGAWPLDHPAEALLDTLPAPWVCAGCGRGPADTELAFLAHELDRPQIRCAALAAIGDCEAGTRALEDAFDAGWPGRMLYDVHQALRAELRRRRAREHFDRHVNLQRDEGFTAERSWSVKARVRILRDIGRGNALHRSTRFTAGEELVMYQHGGAGREIDSKWWTSFDIDGAYILDPADVDVLEVVTATSPYIDDRPAPRTSIRHRKQTS